MFLSFMFQLVQCWLRRTFYLCGPVPLWCVLSAILTVVSYRVGQLLGTPGCWFHLLGLILEMLNLWSDD